MSADPTIDEMLAGERTYKKPQRQHPRTSKAPAQPMASLPPRHSDWFKRVPACLLIPQERWRGPRPTGSADPRWREYRDRGTDLSGASKALSALEREWNLEFKRGTASYYHELSTRLLNLFPAFQALEETRGSKRGGIVEPESAARRARRDKRPLRALLPQAEIVRNFLSATG